MGFSCCQVTSIQMRCFGPTAFAMPVSLRLEFDA